MQRVLDSEAATIILTDFLDRLKNAPGKPQ